MFLRTGLILHGTITVSFETGKVFSGENVIATVTDHPMEEQSLSPFTRVCLFS